MYNNYKVWECYYAARLKYCFLGCLIALITWGAGFLPALALAQTASVSSNVSPVSPAITSRPPSSPMPIPVSEVATEAESALTRMRDLKADLSSDQTMEIVAQQLPVLTRDLDARLSESQKIVAQKPSIEMLSSLEADWLPLQRNMGDWARYLTSRISRLERAMAQLDELDKTWQQTLAVAKGSNTPLETVQRIEAVINAIKQARDAIGKERNRTLSLQNRIATQSDRIADALVSITNARQSILNNLLVKDSPTIWNGDLRTRTTQDLEDESRSSLATQWTTLRDYAERRASLFFVHVFAFGLLAVGFYGAQRQLQLQVETDPASVAPIFEMPIAAALMVALLCSRWIYPQAPRPLWIVLGAMALIPSVVIIRKVIDRQLYPILYALVLFYFVDQVRKLTAAVLLLPRLLFLAARCSWFGSLCTATDRRVLRLKQNA
jgi:potassium-dependent mechanosensitive channel